MIRNLNWCDIQIAWTIVKIYRPTLKKEKENIFDNLLSRPTNFCRVWKNWYSLETERMDCLNSDHFKKMFLVYIHCFLIVGENIYYEIVVSLNCITSTVLSFFWNIVILIFVPKVSHFCICCVSNFTKLRLLKMLQDYSLRKQGKLRCHA